MVLMRNKKNYHQNTPSYLEFSCSKTSDFLKQIIILKSFNSMFLPECLAFETTAEL